MSPASHASHDDRQLVDYLLGRASPEQLERLEEASIVDDEVAARLRIVEDDLVDAYARGALAGDERARFEAHYLSSPRRRQHVRFASGFVRAVDRAAAANPAPQSIGPATRTRPPKILWSMMAVAATLVILTGGLVVRTIQLGRGLAVARTQQSARESRARELERQLRDARVQNEAAARRVEETKEAALSATLRTPVIALVLQPQTRAIGPLPSLTIPAGADRINFRLMLDSSDYPRYRVGLRDPAVNRVTWRSPWLTAQPSAAQAAVQVSVPAAMLKTPHYTLDLMARGVGGAVETVGSYAFEVAAR
jgi:hypothetical protein